MKQKTKRLAFALTACMMFSAMTGPACALEYNFSSDAPGHTFYQSTSTDTNYIAENSQIVVGTDGTISSETTGNVTSSPLSVLDLPVGEYPDAWGTSTDVAIAQNSVFVNEIGPTSANENIYTPVYTPSINSGALPVGYNYVAAGMNGRAWYATQNGYVYAPALGIASSIAEMPAITKGGAIGRLTIPSIGLDKYVYEGTSQANMRKGLAHFESTSGWLGNVGIAGHNRPTSWAAFAKLKDVQMGDTVYYSTAYGTATYVVSSITTCATTDTSGLQQDGVNKLTMYTCKANQPEVKLCVVATMVG